MTSAITYQNGTHPPATDQVPKGPPFNRDAERATLGSILLNREAIIAIAAWLQPSDFYMEQHAWIYEAMLTCYNARIPPDTRTVSEELRRQQRLDKMDGVAYLGELVDAVPTSYHIEYYAQIVQRASLLRRLIAAGGKITALGYDEQDDLDTTLDKAEAALFDVSQRRVTDDFVHVGSVVDSYYDCLNDIQEQSGALVGLPTGFRDLDEVTGGLQRSDLIILAARPSVGKSSCAMSLAYNVASDDQHTVGVFSLEMGREQLVQRLLAMDTGINTQKLRTGQLREQELPLLMQSMGRLASLPIHMNDTAGLTITEMRSICRRMHARQPLDLLIIDYLQLMQGRRTDNRVQEVSEISRGLKALARELDIPIIALSQLSRAVEGRTNHVPMLSDLRESGSIEQDADIVIFIYREELYDKETDKQGIAELHIAKHRNGPTAVVPMRFDASTTRYFDLSYRTPEGY